LADAVGELPADRLESVSGASEWTIADVLSHLGSQAEIFAMFLDAGRDGTDAPGLERFQPVWDVWNAKSPTEQRDDYLTANAAFLARLDAMDEPAKASWHLTMFGSDMGLQGLLQMRLGEHALHTWDVLVALDPNAVVAPDAVDLLVDTLPALAARAGRLPDGTGSVTTDVTTHVPERRFILQADADGVVLTPAEGPPGDEVVELPAEVFVRVVYGRAAADHPSSARGDGLDTIRPLFTGF
jgi:uncharacterized protein (TIGR03083 family)